MQKALDATDYRKLREEQKAKQEAFKRGETRELMGIGVVFFTEIVGAGPSKNCDILGIAMFDSCEIRIHPTGKGIARMGTKSQGQGHETTWAQIIATEIGIPADDIIVEEGNTDTRLTASAPGALSALQEGFREMHGLQCGYCTPGMIIRAHRLLQENPNPTESEIRIGISGNLCRCTGYQNIVSAIQYAAAKMAGLEFKEAAE